MVTMSQMKRARGRYTRSRRRVCVVVVAAVVLATVVSSAKAITGNYWGYNNLSVTNPPAGTCMTNPSYPWPAGFACSGWGNWDQSWVDWTSGSGKFSFGYLCQSDGVFHGRVLNGAGGDVPAFYTAVYYAYCPGHYNKAMVGHDSGTYNYLQAGKN
jgi:hypothetical protein